MRLYYQTDDCANLRKRIYHIIRRCTDPEFQDFRNYGGRGITVCEEWMRNPQSFVDWAFAHGWKRGLQIDRIDNDGPYSPINCRWVTSAENNRNRRNNKLDVEKVARIRELLASGETRKRVAALFGVHHSLITRIHQRKQWT